MCSALPGAYCAADGPMADEGGHRCGARHASGLSGLTSRPTLSRTTSHPKLPGAHSSQCPREAQCQRRSSADVATAERSPASGHTAKIRGATRFTDISAIVPSSRRRKHKVAKTGQSSCPQVASGSFGRGVWIVSWIRRSLVTETKCSINSRPWRNVKTCVTVRKSSACLLAKLERGF